MTNKNDKHIGKLWYDFQWPIIGGIVILVLVLGYVGFYKNFITRGQVQSPLDILYLVLQLFTLQSGLLEGPVGWQLEVARFLAPIIAAYAALRAFTAIFREQIKQLRLRCITNHVIICGLGKKGMLLSRKFSQRGQQVILIELDEGNNLLNQCKDQGLIILAGDASDQEMLHRARVHKAKYLISVCGDDGVNAKVAVQAWELVKGRKENVLTCSVHIVDPYLCHLIAQQELASAKMDNFRLGIFNIFHNGAQSWLEDYNPFTDCKGEHILNPHLLLVGIGRMGISLIIHTAKKWKDTPRKSEEKLIISLIDKEAVRKKETLFLQYPQLEKICYLIPQQMEIESSAFQRAEFLFDNEGKCIVTTIFVCLDNDSFGFSVALALHRHIREHNVPIVVRMACEDGSGLAALIKDENNSDNSFTKFHIFSLLDRTCQPEQVLAGINEILARAIHEDYRERQKKKGQTMENNPSMASWEELEEDLKEANRRQADHIGVKLKELGCSIVPLLDWDEKLFEFTPEEIEMLAKKEHERWVDERRQSHWRLGPKKDIKKKRSPYLVPWESLDNVIKEEDRGPVRNLPKYMAKVGYKIHRKQKTITKEIIHE